MRLTFFFLLAFIANANAQNLRGNVQQSAPQQRGNILIVIVSDNNVGSTSNGSRGNVQVNRGNVNPTNVTTNVSRGNNPVSQAENNTGNLLVNEVIPQTNNSLDRNGSVEIQQQVVNPSVQFDNVGENAVENNNPQIYVSNGTGNEQFELNSDDNYEEQVQVLNDGNQFEFQTQQAFEFREGNKQEKINPSVELSLPEMNLPKGGINVNIGRPGFNLTPESSPKKNTIKKASKNSNYHQQGDSWYLFKKKLSGSKSGKGKKGEKVLKCCF